MKKFVCIKTFRIEGLSWLQLPPRYWTSRMKNLIIFKCYYHSSTCLIKTVLYDTNTEHSLAGCCRLSLSISPHHVILVFGRFVRNVLVSKLSVCCRVTGCMGSKRFSVLGTSFGSEPNLPGRRTRLYVSRVGYQGMCLDETTFKNDDMFDRCRTPFKVDQCR